MTPKQIAEKIAEGLERKGWRIRGSNSHGVTFAELLEVVESLNLTAAPKVEGSVRVKIAVALEPDSHGGHSISTRHPEFTKMECVAGRMFHDGNSHRCYAVIDVPPVAPIPTVEGTVTR